MKLDEMREALSTLCEAFRDADAITKDMLRPPRKRELGPALHADNYGEARASLVQALDRAVKLADEDEPDHGDPSGSGGAGPIH